MSPLIKKTNNKADVRDVTNSKVDVTQVNVEINIAGEKKTITAEGDDFQSVLEGLLTNPQNTSVSATLDSEFHDELNYARDLIDGYKPKEALDYLIELKKRIWSKAGNQVKFRLVTNIGAAHLSLGDDKQASKHFIEAHQYEDSEKSWSNLALAQLLAKNFTEAQKAAKKTLKINPANDGAYSILIQSQSEGKKLDQIIKSVPKEYQSLPQVLAAFGHVALSKNNYSEAEKWTRKALKAKESGDSGIETNLQMAAVLLGSVLQGKSLAESEVVRGDRKDRVEEARDILNDAWKTLRSTQLMNFQIQCLGNRSLANRILGSIDDSLKDIDKILEIEPDNTHFQLMKASLLFEQKQFQEAEKLVTKLIGKEETAPLLLAEVLRMQKKFDDAVEILKKALESGLSVNLKREFTRYLTDLYLQMGNYNEAAKTVSALDDEIPVNLASKASVLRHQGKNEEAVKVLDKAKELIKDKATSIELLSIAAEYFQLGKLKEAVSLYEQLADTSMDNFITRRLLDAYYRLGDDKKTLDTIKALKDNDQSVDDLTELESSIYEDIGDLKKARKVCEKHLEKYSDDHSVKVRLAMVLFRDQKIKILKELLQAGISDSDLPLPKRIQLSQVYSLVDDSMSALKVMYEARRIFYDDSESHAKYIALFFNREKSLDFSTPQVAVDTAVCIEGKRANKRWYVIEDRGKSNPQNGELPLSHPLVKELLGKKVGDTVVLHSNDLQDQKGKVIEIKSKYVHAVHESGEIFNEMFPSDKSFMSLSLDFSEKEKKLPEAFTKMLDQYRERHNRITEIYQAGNITLWILSSMLGRNVIDAWGYAIGNKELGIRCALGNLDERNEADALLNQESHSVAIDLTSILTLHGIGLADIVADNFELLIVPQSTRDLLVEVLATRKGIQSDGFMSVGKGNDGKYVRENISKEQIEDNTKFLESVLDWVNKRCDIVPCREALKLEQSKKSMMYDTLGRPYAETGLLAKQENVPMYSDELWLRAIMRNEFGVTGVWIQPVLKRLVIEAKLPREEYEKALVKLILSNYSYISIDSETLLEAANQADWHSSTPFIEVLRLLGSSADSNSTLVVVEDFAIGLFSRQIYLPGYSELFSHVLDIAAPTINRHKYIRILSARLRRKLALTPNVLNTIEREINEWLRWQSL